MILSAVKRKGLVSVLYELEEKLSRFYGTAIKVTTLLMDAWLCESMREVDNVVICLDPKMG